jgi:hypothetical protein
MTLEKMHLLPCAVPWLKVAMQWFVRSKRAQLMLAN